MRNKVLRFLRQEQLLKPGDLITCAVSGGADSMALLWCLWELQEKLGIRVEAAHFNHGLRGAESDADEAFVKRFCDRYEIPLTVGRGQVVPGKKGLEAAAREARYSFFRTLPGLIATAHTADDNAETVLLHLVRGTGLKGLGGIAPKRGNVIRPMLTVTRQEVLAFLEEWSIPHVEDSSNGEDAFLRNRLRHHVMPLLAEENPRIGENLSAMALRLRLEDEALDALSKPGETLVVSELRQQPAAIRSRTLASFMKQNGVLEPEARHIAQADALVFAESPSAFSRFPGGIVLRRQYDRLVADREQQSLLLRYLTCPGETELPEIGLRVQCVPGVSDDGFTVYPQGEIVIRSRASGDTMRLPGGTKTLKKLLIDQKIPAATRNLLPVAADEAGILAVYSIGVNQDRTTGEGTPVTIRFLQIHSDD